MAASAHVVEDDIGIKTMNQSKDCPSGRDNSNFDPDINLLPEELFEVPTYKYTKNCSPELIEETREIFKERFKQLAKNSIYQSDYDLILSDDWCVSRFLLRCRLNPGRACDLLQQFALFRKQYKMSEANYHHFPKELYTLANEFVYQPDIAGNITVWMRAKEHRRVPELFELYKKYILCVAADVDTKNGGRGVTWVLDCTDAGFRSVDFQIIYWCISTFRDVFPKGLTYFLVVNLPRALRAASELAVNWLSKTNKKRLRFANGEQIFKYIPRENVPKYLGGTCPLEPNRSAYLNVDEIEPARVIEDESHPVQLSKRDLDILLHHYKKRCTPKSSW